MTRTPVTLDKAALLAKYLGLPEVFVTEKIELKMMALKSLELLKTPNSSANNDFSITDKVEIFCKNGNIVTVSSGMSVGETIALERIQDIRGVILTTVQPGEGKTPEISQTVFFVSPQDEAAVVAALKKKIIEMLMLENKVTSLQAIHNILTKAIQDDVIGQKVMCSTLSKMAH